MIWTNIWSWKQGENYKLIWPAKPEFVRTAIRHGAVIIPMAAVGGDEFIKVLQFHTWKKHSSEHFSHGLESLFTYLVCSHKGRWMYCSNLVILKTTEPGSLWIKYPGTVAHLTCLLIYAIVERTESIGSRSNFKLTDSRRAAGPPRKRNASCQVQNSPPLPLTYRLRLIENFDMCKSVIWERWTVQSVWIDESLATWNWVGNCIRSLMVLVSSIFWAIW